MAIKTGLDRERVNGLIESILVPIHDNYLRGPFERDRVYETLNALAYCVSITVQGTRTGQENTEGLDFFLAALELQMSVDLAEEYKKAQSSN